MDSWASGVEFETMTDRFAEDVTTAVITGIPADGRSLNDAIRAAFKRETGMGREILADRAPENERIAR